MGLFSLLFKKTKKPTLLDDIATTKDWIANALQSSGYKADFSIESLKEIDRFFDEQNCPGGLLSESVGIRLFAIGSYIGDVLISNCGGKWVTDDTDPHGEINIAVELPSGIILWPMQRVMKRCQNGSEDGIYAYGIYAVTNK